MDMSRQTRKANAFVTGIGRTHRIVLGDTLIAAFPEDETEFVVAHELGHYVNKDTWRTIALGEVLATALFLVANAAAPERERERAARSTAARRSASTRSCSARRRCLRPLLLAFSRSREWAADRFALAATGDPAAGRPRVSALARPESRRRRSAGLVRALLLFAPVAARADRGARSDRALGENRRGSGSQPGR